MLIFSQYNSLRQKNLTEVLQASLSFWDIFVVYERKKLNSTISGTIFYMVFGFFSHLPLKYWVLYMIYLGICLYICYPHFRCNI